METEMTSEQTTTTSYDAILCKCVDCGKGFHRSPSQVKKAHQTFCSRKCRINYYAANAQKRVADVETLQRLCELTDDPELRLQINEALPKLVVTLEMIESSDDPAQRDNLIREYLKDIKLRRHSRKLSEARRKQNTQQLLRMRDANNARYAERLKEIMPIIIKMMQAGQNFSLIAEELNRQGITNSNGKPWTYNSVYFANRRIKLLRAEGALVE